MTSNNDFTKRFNELEEEFRRAHGGGGANVQPEPVVDEVPVTMDAIFANDNVVQTAPPAQASDEVPVTMDAIFVDDNIGRTAPSAVASDEVPITLSEIFGDDNAAKTDSSLNTPDEVPITLSEIFGDDNAVKTDSSLNTPDEVPITLNEIFGDDNAAKTDSSLNTPDEVPITLSEIFGDDNVAKTDSPIHAPNETPITLDKILGDDNVAKPNPGETDLQESVPDKMHLSLDEIFADQDTTGTDSKEPSSDGGPRTLGAIFSDDDVVSTPLEEAATKEEEKPSDSTTEGKREGYMARSSRKNKRQRQRKKQKLVHKILKGVLSGILILIMAACAFGFVYVYGIIKDTPKFKTEDITARLSLMSTLYDDQGVPMKNVYLPDGQRELITFDQLNDNTINAFVAIEDKTFWTHKGFNVTRLVGAVLESFRSGGGISGTSTITQQFARNMWLADTKSDRTLERKIQEAYYARQIEQDLSKEEIFTDYLNSIAFGNHSYGIQAAAKSYFGKEVEDLDLIESAALAALPKGPTEYSMIITVTPGEVAPDDPSIILAGAQYTYLYSDNVVPRLQLVLSEMLAQGYITESEYNAAMADNIRSHLHPTELESNSNADFFSSYAIENIADDILRRSEDVTTRDQAIQMIYSGGLDIYTTFNQRAQDIATEEYSNPENFPTIDRSRSDSNGNLLEPSNSNIMLYKYQNMFTVREDGSAWFYLSPEGENPDFAWNADGTMTIYAGRKLGIYRTNSDAGGADISLELRDFYHVHDDDGFLYMTKGGYIPIPKEYKGTDANGNLLLSADYFRSDSNIFDTDEETGGLWIGPSHYTLRQEILQPQSAFVLIDHTNGQLKAMVGGRGEIIGQLNYNRAISPRQPGSTMKPIGVYGPAIEMSANGEAVGSDVTTYGPYWAPMSIIIDEEIQYLGRTWPKNWYNSFRGPMTMRKALEQSVNVTAVKVQLAIGNQRSINFLKKLGISTLVETGDPNDLAPGALALGGMTRGISPLEMASAYGTFANAGVHIAPTTYTVIKYKDGGIFLESEPERVQAMNPGTAFIVNDMLRTTISNGIASAASVKGTSVAGKTGTADSNFDAWFVGSTPKYSSAIWIGGDVSVRMSQGSAAASRLFNKIVTRVIEGEEQGEYPEKPDNVILATVSTGVTNDPELPESYTDYFILGTVHDKVDFGIIELDVCAESGYLATPWCDYHELRKFSTAVPKPGEDFTGFEAPTFYCHRHNMDPVQFPTNPLESFNYDFGTSEIPSLVGLSYEDAVTKLSSLRLIIGPKTFAPGFNPAPYGQVLTQSMGPGIKVVWDTVINVTVSNGPGTVSVPNLAGQPSQAAANAILAGAGLVQGTVNVIPGTGGVTSQSPAAGTSVAPGSAVNYTLEQ